MSENMVLLTAENIRKSYGTRVIFDDISFSIHEGDKIGVIGVNGTGKSTLLKIIAGVDQADSGTIVTMNGMRIGYLSQSPVFVDGTTVLQQVFTEKIRSLRWCGNMRKRWRHLQKRLRRKGL